MINSIVLIIIDVNAQVLFENCVDNFNLFVYFKMKRDKQF